MKASELAEMIMRAPTRRLDDEVSVVVHAPGSIGASPSSVVTNAGYGFDWDNGQFQLFTADKLTKLTQDQVDAIQASARGGQSWHAYQAQKKLRERIVQLEAEIAALRKGVTQ